MILHIFVYIYLNYSTFYKFINFFEKNRNKTKTFKSNIKYYVMKINYFNNL